MARRRSNVYIQWAEPEATIVQHKLIGLADELEDYTAPLLASRTIAQEDIDLHFKTGTDPAGKKWEEWSPSYEPYALTHSTGRIFGDRANLHLSGDLREAATDSKAFVVTSVGLFFDTSDLPEYWAWNNFGSERATTGGGGEVSEAEIRKRAQQILVREFKASRTIDKAGALSKARAEFKSTGTNVLPRRTFAGLSLAAEARILAIFDRWFDSTVEFFETKPVRIFARTRIPKGQPGAGRFAKL